MSVSATAVSGLFTATLLAAQTVTIIPATPVNMPAHTVDGNSPSFRDEAGILHVYTSTGAEPARMSGESLFSLGNSTPPSVEPRDHYPIWIEAVWRDDDGTVYGWYHHEPNAEGICGGRKLTTPRIGAVVSLDGGVTFSDLGLVLTSGDQPNCAAQNGFFAGGHGDFSVILDRNREYFYFLFTNYGGSAHQQGVSIARMPFADRGNPSGTVLKYYLGGWSEPGIGGMVSPIFPSFVAWDSAEADSFWGPAVHWNTKLETYVVVMNRACCKTNWPQEGIYIAFASDLAHPELFTSPGKLIDADEIGFAPGYYPQVFGSGDGETDSLVGEEARLFIKGSSRWRLVFGDDYLLEPPVQVTPDCLTAECFSTKPGSGAAAQRRLQASPRLSRR